MTNEKLEIVLGTILANTMLILQNMDFDLETPIENFEEIEIAIDTSEQVLAMLTEDMGGDTE